MAQCRAQEPVGHPITRSHPFLKRWGWQEGHHSHTPSAAPQEPPRLSPFWGAVMLGRLGSKVPGCVSLGVIGQHVVEQCEKIQGLCKDSGVSVGAGAEDEGLWH